MASCSLTTCCSNFSTLQKQIFVVVNLPRVGENRINVLSENGHKLETELDFLKVLQLGIFINKNCIIPIERSTTLEFFWHIMIVDINILMMKLALDGNA